MHIVHLIAFLLRTIIMRCCYLVDLIYLNGMSHLLIINK